MKVRYLIIRFSSIGDIVLTSPVVRCLKLQVADAEVHYVVKDQFVPLVSANPYVDKVHSFDGNMPELLTRLESENIDYIIDLHNNFRSNRIKHQLKSPAFTFKKLNIQKFLLVNFKIDKMPEEHIVDRYLETLNVFDVKNDEKGLDFFIPSGDGYDTKQLPPEFREGYIALVIAGTWTTKKLPVHKIIDICNRIDFPFVILGGKSEEEAGEKIQLQSQLNVLNLTGQLDMYQSASLVRDARLVITNDTGLMHIAAAFHKKILSFWGNTVPQFGMTPYYADPVSEFMEVKNLKCRPCSKIGYRICPKKHFKCMENQDVEKAVNWINRNFNP